LSVLVTRTQKAIRPNMHPILSLLLAGFWLVVLALSLGGLVWIARGRPRLLAPTAVALVTLSVWLSGTWRRLFALTAHLHRTRRLGRQNAILDAQAQASSGGDEHAAHGEGGVSAVASEPPVPTATADGETPSSTQPSVSPAQTLYRHTAHPHVPQNATDRHKAELARGGFNQRLAVFLTVYVGTMQTAYGFTALAFVGLLGVLAILTPTIYTLVAWLSQTLIQLVLLPVIMVGQNVLNRHAEIQADEQFQATLHTLHDSDQMIQHLDAQDVELLKQTAELLKQTPMLQDVHDLLRALAMAQGVALPTVPAAVAAVAAASATPHESAASSSSSSAEPILPAPVALASHPATARRRRSGGRSSGSGKRTTKTE
jgi:uncharacterized membrane protein